MKYPSIVVLFTSYRCNARCIMCSAWQKKIPHPELSLEDIKHIFSDTILTRSVETINITGGEPTLRDDLVEIVKILTDRCINLKRIDISTNGIDNFKVIDQIEQLLAYILQTEIRLTVSVSVDGVGDTHDVVRGIPGAFDKVDKTIDDLKELMILYPTFSAGMNTTVNKVNYNNLNSILDYSIKKGLGTNFTLAAISEIGVESALLRDNFELGCEEKKEILTFIKYLLSQNQLNSLYGEFLLHWLKAGERKGPCAFRRGKAILCEPDGSVYLCGNFREFRIGNLLHQSFEQIINYRNNFLNFYEIKCKSCNSNCYIDAA